MRLGKYMALALVAVFGVVGVAFAGLSLNFSNSFTLNGTGFTSVTKVLEADCSDVDVVPDNAIEDVHEELEIDGKTYCYVNYLVMANSSPTPTPSSTPTPTPTTTPTPTPTPTPSPSPTPTPTPSIPDQCSGITFDNVIEAKGGEASVWYGTPDNDYIYVSDGIATELRGRAGNDCLVAPNGSVLKGNRGDDVLLNTGAGNGVLRGGLGTDYCEYGHGASVGSCELPE